MYVILNENIHFPKVTSLLKLPMNMWTGKLIV